MGKQASCQACGTEGTLGQAVRTLTHVDADTGGGSQPIHLCQGCLMRRAAKVWHAQGSEGERLQSALAENPRPSSSRFSYLEEPGQRIHLLRLRSEWLDEQSRE